MIVVRGWRWAGDRRGGVPGCRHSLRPQRYDDIYLELDQLGRKFGQPVEPTLCETIVDDNILAFNPPELTQPLPERFLRLEGVNTAASNAKVLIELYRVAFDPLKKFDIISNDLNKFEMEGSLLADASKPYDAVLGQFGRIVQL